MNLILSLCIIILLTIFNFYGLYTNKFYFFKFDNYIFPLLAMVHLVFLYAMWSKIKEEELADTQMRNLEYSLYIIFFVYVFKVFDSITILWSYTEFENHVNPGTFVPIGSFILALYLVLLVLTLLTFKQRREIVGDYSFETINENLGSRQE